MMTKSRGLEYSPVYAKYGARIYGGSSYFPFFVWTWAMKPSPVVFDHETDARVFSGKGDHEVTPWNSFKPYIDSRQFEESSVLVLPKKGAA